jgi:TonB family protein
VRRIFLLAVILVFLAACRSHRPRQVESAGATKATSQIKIMVGDTLSRPGNCWLSPAHYVRPVYPKEARRIRLQGVVRIRALIRKTGELAEIEVQSGDPVFVPAALTAVKQWRYDPCLFNGEPIEVRTVIDVPFTLNQ